MYEILTVVVGAVIALLITCKQKAWNRRKGKLGLDENNHLLNKHVVITGGSSGIGLAVAKEVAKRGANITIIARSKDKLEEAQKEITRHLVFPDRQKVSHFSVDITSSHFESEVGHIEAAMGSVFMLVNCAGISIPMKFENLTNDQVRYMMDVNYFGSVNSTRAFLPSIKSNPNGGIIVFVSSLAGLVGLFGFTGYSASKFAVRGFAEALAMEVAPFGISVTVNCPPDTDTPGLKEEDKLKCEETRLISQTAGLIQPEIVAKALVNDAIAGKFLSSNGLDGFMLTQLCSGMGPSSMFQVIIQSILMGIFRMIAWGHVQYFNMIVRQCHAKRNGGKKLE